MLALRTVTYCTENEETPPGRTVRHRPDQDGSDLRRRVACGRRHPGQHLRSRWHRRSGHQRGAARRRATGSRAAVSWHAKSPIGNVGIAPLAESSSPLGGTRSEQEDRRSVHRFIGSSVHRISGSAAAARPIPPTPSMADCNARTWQVRAKIASAPRADNEWDLYSFDPPPLRVRPILGLRQLPVDNFNLPQRLSP